MDPNEQLGAGTGTPQPGSETPTATQPEATPPRQEATTPPPPPQPRGIMIPEEVVVAQLRAAGFTDQAIYKALTDPDFHQKGVPGLFGVGLKAQVEAEKAKRKKQAETQAQELSDAQMSRMNQIMAEAEAKHPDDMGAQLRYAMAVSSREAAEMGALHGAKLAKEEIYSELNQRAQQNNAVRTSMDTFLTSHEDFKGDQEYADTFIRFIGTSRAQFDTIEDAYETFKAAHTHVRGGKIVPFKKGSGGIGSPHYEDVTGTGAPQQKGDVQQRAKAASENIRKLAPHERTPEAVRAAYANVW